jgi:hypothetical protein
MSTDKNALSHSEALDRLLSTAQQDAPIAILQDALTQLLDAERSEAEMVDWRLRRGKLKKVCDEIIPVARLMRYLGAKRGTLRFPLDSKVPDCFWTPSSAGRPIGIEVTIAQGRGRHILAEELVRAPRGGITRGFVSLQDGAPKAQVKATKESQRAMYSTAQALNAVGGGILRCLHEKNQEKYRDMVLVIEAPLEALPQERWKTLQPDLAAEAKSLPFQRVFVLGGGERLPVLELK